MNIKINKILAFATTVFFLSQPSVHSFNFTIEPAEAADDSASAATTDYSWLTPPTKPEQTTVISTPAPEGPAAEQPATAAPAQNQNYSWLKLPAENPTAPTFTPTTGGLDSRVLKTPSNGGWLKFMLLTAGPKIAMDLIFDFGLAHLTNETLLNLGGNNNPRRWLHGLRQNKIDIINTKLARLNALTDEAKTPKDHLEKLQLTIHTSLMPNAKNVLLNLSRIPLTITKQIIYYYGQDAYYYLNPATHRQKPEDVLWQITKELCDKMELDMPNVYVLNCSCPQIFLRGRKSLVLTSAMLRHLNINELTAIIGSELAHRKLNFVAARNTMITSRKALSYGINALYGISLYEGSKPGIAISGISLLNYPLLFAPLSRQFDYKADALSAKVTGKPWALVSALEKLNKVHRPFFKRLSILVKRSKVLSADTLLSNIEAAKKLAILKTISILALQILLSGGLKRKVFRDLLSNRPSLNNRIRALRKNFNADPSQGLALQFDAKAAAAKALKTDGNVHILT